MVVRLGDASFNTGNRAVGTALPVYFDYLDRQGRVWLSRGAAQAVSGRQNPCTLSFGDVSSSSTSWWLETEGLPSLAAAQGDRVVLPCHASPPGSRLTTLLFDNKVIAQLSRSGVVDTSVRFEGFTGLRGTATGIRQVATFDGSAFWIAGIARTQYGVRYLRPGMPNASRVYGQTIYPVQPPRYQAATLDVRSIMLWSRSLYITSSYAVERNRNMDASPFNPWGGLIRLGSVGVPPTTSISAAQLLEGFDGRKNFWTMAMEPQGKSVWLVRDLATYTRSSAPMSNVFDEQVSVEPLAQIDDSARPVFTRSNLRSQLVNWAWQSGVNRWTEQPAKAIFINDALYSSTGRIEAGGWVAYATGRRTLYKVVTTTKVVPTEVVRCWWCVAEALCTDVWEVVSTPSRKINPTITQGAGCQAARRSKALPATGKQA